MTQLKLPFEFVTMDCKYDIVSTEHPEELIAWLVEAVDKANSVDASHPDSYDNRVIRHLGALGGLVGRDDPDGTYD